MPSYHIWIRKEDEAKWKAIENKPEWLHEHLNDYQWPESIVDEAGKKYFIEPTIAPAEESHQTFFKNKKK